MKIKRAVPKKISQPPLELKEVIDRASEVIEEELPLLLNGFQEWKYARGDLFHWVTVLNRFDGILERICKEYVLKSVQTIVFTIKTKELLLAILRFSTILLDNCSNRNIYNSCNYLNDLLYSTDIDVVEHTLCLSLRLAQRVSSQRYYRSNYFISSERCLKLAMSLQQSSQERGTSGIDMVKLLSDSYATDIYKSVYYAFYRHLNPIEAIALSSTKDKETLSSTPVSKGKVKENQSLSLSESIDDSAEGMTAIKIGSEKLYNRQVEDIFSDAISTYNIPTANYFDLMLRIRFAKYVYDKKKRQQLVCIKILAIAVLAYTVQEHVLHSRFFIFEPDIIINLAQLIHPDNKISKEIEIASFYALEALAHHRPKLMDVLLALNASVNHGILMYVFRTMIIELENSGFTKVFLKEYVDALFLLIHYLTTTQQGGNMLTSAGIISFLIRLLKNKTPKAIRAVTKATSLLDHLTYGFPSTFSSFCSARGLDVLVERIKCEVDYNIEQFLLPGKTSKTSLIEHSMSQERFIVLKTMLKFTLHMMQSTGTSDGLRNLIDSSLLETLKKIFIYFEDFGPSIIAMSINILSTFIHNEPTSYSIIHEVKLSETFLKMTSSLILPSPDVISAIPNAFGAICLNTQGMELFNSIKPLSSFFSIFTSSLHRKALQESELSSILGTSFDELVRHHPSLKSDVIDEVLSMLKRVLQIGTELTNIIDNANMSTTTSDSDLNSQNDVVMKEKLDYIEDDENGVKRPVIVSHIDFVSRFLEGFFQNSSHCREFLRNNGLDILLQYYSLPCLPYDFIDTPASYSLSHLFRIISEVNVQSVLLDIVKYFQKSLNKLDIFLEHKGLESFFERYLKLLPTGLEFVFSGNCFLKDLSQVHSLGSLLSDIYELPIFSHARSALSFFQLFLSNPELDGLLEKIGHLVRVSVWESINLLNIIPSDLEEATRLSDDSKIKNNDKEKKDSKLDQSIDRSSPVFLSIKMIRYLLAQIPTSLNNFFQGLSKMLITHRFSDSGQRKMALKVANIIGVILAQHLKWEKLDNVEFVNNKYMYWVMVLGFNQAVILEEKQQISVQTIVLLAFDKFGGIHATLHILKTFWQEVDKLSSISERSKDSCSITFRVYDGIKIILQFFKVITLPKALLISLQTSGLSFREKDKDKPDYFNPSDFIAQLRANVLPPIKDLWASDILYKIPYLNVKFIVQIFTQIFKIEGEMNEKAESNASLVASGHRALSGLSEERIRQLCDMGFARSAAETALMRCGNHLSTATEYLLAHPELNQDTGTSRSHSNANSLSNHPFSSQNEQVNNSTRDHVGATQDSSSALTSFLNSIDQSAFSTDGNNEQIISRSNDTEKLEINTVSVKGKGKDNSKVDTKAHVDTNLSGVRKSIKTDLIERVLTLLNIHNNLVFELSALILETCVYFNENSWNVYVVECIVNKICELESKIKSSESDGLKAASILHLLGLLLHDSSFYESCKNEILNFQPVFICFLTRENDKPSPWLAPVLLVFEQIIITSIQPKQQPLLPASEDSAPRVVSDLFFLVQKESIFDAILELFKTEFQKIDDILSLLRVLVILTRSKDIVVRFFQKDGMQLLFSAIKSISGKYQNEHLQILIVTILRHLIEDLDVIKNIMTTEVKSYFNQSRFRGLDINAFLRNNAHLVLRDPDIFVDVIEKECKFPRYDIHNRIQQIALKDSEFIENSVQEITSTDQTSMSSKLSCQDVIEINKLEDPDSVIFFLLSELLDCKDGFDYEEIKQLDSANADTVNTAASNVDQSKTSGTISKENEFKAEEHPQYMYKCFLLQCLAELLSSYKHCKLEFVNFSKKYVFKGVVLPSKVRSTMLSYLLYDVIPYGTINPSENIQIRKRFSASNWAISVIISLCASTSESVEEKNKSDLVFVRKLVLESISKAFKDASCSLEPLEMRYSRLLTLSELCYRLLVARANIKGVSNYINDDHKKIAKLMLEKNFMSILTGALADIDLNFPSSKRLVRLILRPLRKLSQIAVELNENSEIEKPDNNDKQDETLTDASISEREPLDEREETLDLYRNSALGMFHGEMEDNENSNEFDSDDEEIYDEMDFDEEDSETGSVLSDEDNDIDMGSQQNGEMDVEIILDDQVDTDDDVNEQTELGLNDVIDDPNRASEDGFDVETDDESGWQTDSIDDITNEDDDNDGGRSDRRSWHAITSGGCHFISEPNVQVFRRSSRINNGMENNINPLLIDSTSVSQRHVLQSRDSFSRSDSFTDWVQSIEQLIGGGAVQVLGDVMNRVSRQIRGPSQHAIRVEVNTSNGSLLTREVERMFGQRSQSVQQNQRSSREDPITAVAILSPTSTSQRWSDEARLIYGNTVVEKALLMLNSLMNVLVPQAIRDERIRKEKEKVLEEVKKSQITENSGDDKNNGKNMEDELSGNESDKTGCTVADVSTMDGVENIPSQIQERSVDESVGPSQRVTVMLRGNEVDITSLDIDPTFLEALPEDMREDVLTQHIRDQRVAALTNQSSEISPEFLNALPDEIREELLQQEAADRRRREREQQIYSSRNNVDVTTSGPVEIDPVTFLATLDPYLRRQVLLDQNDEFLSQLPPSLAEEVNVLRERSTGRLSQILQIPASSSHQRETNSSLPKKSSTKHEIVQLLDKAGIATLVRLLFIPQPNGKNPLHDILLSVCKNRQNRIEVINLLLSVLQDGTNDLYAVDKSFSQMSLRAKNTTLKGTPKSKTTSKCPLSSFLQSNGENMPNLVTQQCIEALEFLVQWNEHLPSYFLNEHDHIIRPRRSNSRKDKGKDTITKGSKYAINILLSLLDRDSILQNSSIMDQFSHLLSIITRSLSTLKKRGKQESESCKNSKSPQLQSEVNEDTIDERSEQNVDSHSDADIKIVDNNDKDQEAMSKNRVIESPYIPESNLRLIVNILTSRDCSSKTFQHTLTAMQYLTIIPGSKDIIGDELVCKAQTFGSRLLGQLDDLIQQIRNVSCGAELQGSALSEFSPASSDQAKLLRILKAISYLFEQKEKSDSTETEDNNSDLSRLYDSLTFQPLWGKLSICLSAIQERPDMMHIATILLPMIESLMVICKNTALKDISKRTYGSRHPTPAEDSMESIFFSFTENHRKILNQMVRNNPSLMSGSVSLLVKNPKILDFDNKRNYFNRRLHDRGSSREHYPPLQLNVRREMIFLDSYLALYFKSGDEMKYSKLNIRFHGEEGVDAGGLTREWYQALARQMFNPDYALFIPVAADKTTFHPNRRSDVNQDHLSFFKFIGRIIGKALYDNRLLDSHFSRAVYKKILGKPVSLKDIETLDLEYYKSLVWMLENDITDVITETFSVETENYGATETVDLIPGGRSILVTEENKHEYVKAVIEYRLINSVKDQLDNFLIGFYDIIPPDLIQIFNEQELELLISGLPDIDVDDWRHNTEYCNYTASSPQIQWFWRAVRSFDDEQRAKLLQFATGTSKVPLNGFKGLEGMQGIQKFSIHRDPTSSDRLPQSHTCYNQIDLPVYESYEALRAALLTAINEGSEGFGFA
ncbi:hypothetical protein PORY_001890 [Pneumocystis oryctolagi]|uniref:Uncharacterized protein n=1 Tax=Pneumocystis oryctolagi TaxID=42067 RepID=A0ACB7CCP0_9ASCO|nr:hypothetical protein PORY_001890 [Pneumocystis oryctolagi]